MLDAEQGAQPEDARNDNVGDAVPGKVDDEKRHARDDCGMCIDIYIEGESRNLTIVS